MIFELAENEYNHTILLKFRPKLLWSGSGYLNKIVESMS